MREVCSRCHLRLDRGENDYFLGALVVNFITAELVIVLIGFAVAFVTWPDVPWTGLKWGLLILMIPVPILFYPLAKTLWLAIDLTFRPVSKRDFLDPLEADTRTRSV